MLVGHLNGNVILFNFWNKSLFSKIRKNCIVYFFFNDRNFTDFKKLVFLRIFMGVIIGYIYSKFKINQNGINNFIYWYNFIIIIY